MALLDNNPILSVNKTITDQTICQTYDSGIYSSEGIWSGDNPLNHIIPVFTVQIIMAFFVSHMVYTILRPLKQPKLVCQVLGGIILGPSVLGRNKPYLDSFYPIKDTYMFGTISAVGVILFVFIIVVKMDRSMILGTARSTWTISTSCLVVPIIISMCLFLMLGEYLPGIQGRHIHLILTLNSSVTSFPVVAHALDELNLLTSELGQLAMSCAMLNDMIGWFLKFVLLVLIQPKPIHSAGALLSMGALFLFIIYVVQPAVLWIVKTTPEGKPVEEIYVIAILIGSLIIGVFSDILCGSIFPGLIIYGFIIPNGPPLGATLVEKSELIISEFFLPLFFIHVGYVADISSLQDWKAFGVLIPISVATYIGKMLGVLLASLFYKTRLRNVLLLGLILNIKGLLELVYLTRFVTRKKLDVQSYTTLVLCNVAPTAIITPLIEILYKPHVRLEAPDSDKSRARSLQITPQNGELRIISCIHNEDHVHSIITLLETLNPTRTSPVYAYVIHLVELVDRAAPILVHHKKKRRSPSNSDRIVRAFRNYSKNSRGPVTIEPFTMIAPYKNMHESICRLAQDKNIPVIIVPFHQNRELHDGQSNALRCFNTNLQAYAPCTVGIFVDRGLACHLNFAHYSCNIAVLFLGGPDDREALMFATRLSCHPDVSITMLQIHFRGSTEENVSERLLDDLVLQDFKTKNIGNSCAVYREVVVENSLQLMDAIRSLENNYDLVIVGRQQGHKAFFHDEMVEWTEYMELGVIGDMLASSDFGGGMMSVLVFQQCEKVGGAVHDSILVNYTMLDT